MAAVCGLDPGPLTFAELRDAYDHKCDFDWEQTSSLMALIANRHRDPKKEHAYRPDAFYRPRHRPKRKFRKSVGDIGALKAMFTRPA